MKYKGLSVAVYTQITDVEHDVNGLLTYDCAVEKMEIKRIKEVNQAVISEGKKYKAVSTGKTSQAMYEPSY